MGIFFDGDWFDDRLKAVGLTRGAMAQAAGMTIDEIEMVFSDRRELEGTEVQAIARVLSADPREVANRSGAADPGTLAAPARAASAPASQAGGVTREMITGIHERLDRLEQLIEVVIKKVDQLR